MQAIVWILRFAIVVVLVWFAVKNAQEVTLYGLPDQTLKAPLVFVLLVVFVAGVIIGLLAWVPTVIRQRREIARLRRAAEKQAALASITPPAAPAVAPPRELTKSPDGV
jgi:lipopolysaccharide assembly protein A